MRGRPRRTHCAKGHELGATHFNKCEICKVAARRAAAKAKHIPTKVTKIYRPAWSHIE